jgi:hypothetical protein
MGFPKDGSPGRREVDLGMAAAKAERYKSLEKRLEEEKHNANVMEAEILLKEGKLEDAWALIEKRVSRIEIAIAKAAAGNGYQRMWLASTKFFGAGLLYNVSDASFVGVGLEIEALLPQSGPIIQPFGAIQGLLLKQNITYQTLPDQTNTIISKYALLDISIGIKRYQEILSNMHLYGYFAPGWVLQNSWHSGFSSQLGCGALYYRGNTRFGFGLRHTFYLTRQQNIKFNQFGNANVDWSYRWINELGVEAIISFYSW